MEKLGIVLDVRYALNRLLSQKNIHIITEWIFKQISSTEVRFVCAQVVALRCMLLLSARRAVSRDQSIKYLVPDSAIDYIRENNLYK